MTNYRLVFWEPCESPHKHDLFRHLRAHPRVDEVTVVAQSRLPAFRRQQGWTMASAPPYATLFAPDRRAIETIFAAPHPRTLHVFSGMRWVPCVTEGLRHAIATGAAFGLMSEPRVWEGVTGWMRYLHSWLTEHRLRQRADFVLAIGRHGPPWFRAVGYREERIFPFAYFLAPPPSTGDPPTHRGAVRIGYLGQLEKAKGFHHFVQALDHLPLPFEAHIAGGGRLAGLAEARAARDRDTHYHGVLTMDEAGRLIERCDIVVAPSLTRGDGWGAVVSEGLLSGAAVVCSDRVGASVCVDHPGRGRMVPAGSPAAIAEAIRSLVESGMTTPARRAERRGWATDHLTGAVGAEHFMDIVAAVYEGAARPPPFYR